ncbi:hypothetical protein EIP91_007295 [Steccherinum ochraceum]|uniref:Uncharacterized protein n=1 Tax=Steccherinum ochraceum TaxID=92696 RepID=A0A4R0R6Z8_9APHY|nr:hypothetical protein EIP91_007295 [Steccherinum ochraceum]
MAAITIPFSVVENLPKFVNDLLSGYLVIVYLTLTLYGMLLAQVYHYALHARDDAKLLKYTVALVAALETLHTAFMLHATYVYGVLNLVDPLNYLTIPWSAGIAIALGMLIVLVVQTFYIRRVYVLSKRSFLPTFILSFFLFLRAPVLIFYLYQSKSGFKRTDHLVHTLSAYAVNSGAITMCCSTLTLVTVRFSDFSVWNISVTSDIYQFFVMEENLVFAGLILMSGKPSTQEIVFACKFKPTDPLK